MSNSIKSAVHVATAFGAYWLAHAATSPFSPTWQRLWTGDGIAAATVYALIALGVELIFQTERTSWRYVSIQDAVRLVRSTVLTAVAFLAASLVLSGLNWAPLIALTAWILHLGGLAAMRMIRRLAHEDSLLGALVPLLHARPDGTKPILLVGGLGVAESFLRELARDPQPEYRALGILTPAAGDMNRIVRGVAVVGVPDDLENTVINYADLLGESPSVLFLSPPDVVQTIPPGALGRLKSTGVSLLRLPAIHELSAAQTTLPSALREVSLEELLSRPTVQLDLQKIHELVNGKRVLVTGAGGSIGAELCRQVAAFGCRHLALLDHSEFGLFKIDQEISVSHPNLSRVEMICDVRDGPRIMACVKTAAPDIIFHAAALKHVPMVEHHPAEGLLTNVIGTWNVAEGARAAGVRQVVLISTDKAVDPNNVMGATKRLAEGVVRGQHGRSRTLFSVVRFGNVLGSAGSVVPTFQAQIERGGPVTVTHADVERYFMTIPEAVQLVLHATAESAGRDLPRPSVFVLEMGEPVKIVDLARAMISLHGLTADRDIDIRFTGLRPGERLTETLIDSNERVLADIGSVIEVIDHGASSAVSAHQVRDLERIARSGDEHATRQALFAHVARLRGHKSPHAGPGSVAGHHAATRAI